MKANRREDVRRLSFIDHDTSSSLPAGSKWVPSPRLRHGALSLRPESAGPARTPDAEPHALSSGANNPVLVLNRAAGPEAGHLPRQDHGDGVRFGFSAPDDRLTSLTVPAEGFFGRRHSSLSFDIEFDHEHPDTVTISLMDLDEDDFIRTVHRTVRFPARHLAELLSRRKATAEEARMWHEADGQS